MVAANAILILALLFVGVAAVLDLRTGHIPNHWTLGGLAVGALAQILSRCVFERPLDAPFQVSLLAWSVVYVLLGVLACGLVPYLLFLRNGMGGGDVKLLAAVGAFLGPIAGIEVELYAFVVMALFAPVRLAYEGRLLRVLGNSAALLANPFLPKERRRTVAPELLTALKFGPAVFVGLATVTLLRWRMA